MISLNNRVYDSLKWFVLIVLPAVSVLIQGLGDLYGYSSSDVVVSTVNLFTVFIGTILQISSKNYYDWGTNNGNSTISYI